MFPTGLHFLAVVSVPKVNGRGDASQLMEPAKTPARCPHESPELDPTWRDWGGATGWRSGAEGLPRLREPQECGRGAQGLREVKVEG